MGRWAVVVLAVGVWLPGCSDQGPDDALLTQVRSARERWEGSRPAVYVYRVERVCGECASEARGTVSVRVEGVTVTERRYDDGAPVPVHVAALFPSVDGLLDLIEDAIAREAYEVSVQYDPVTGVPLVVRIDYEAFTFDEEQYYVVRTPPAPPTG